MKRRNFLMAVAGAVAAIPLAKTVTEAESPHGSVTAIESGEAHLEGIVLPAQSSVSQWRDTSGFLNAAISLPSHPHPLPFLPYHGVTLERAWRIVNDPEYVNYHGEFPEYDANYPIKQIAEASGQFAYSVFDTRNNESIRMSYWLQYADATIESQELASRTLYLEHLGVARERALENTYMVASASALVSRDFSFSERARAKMPDAEIKARAEFLTNKIE